jgi:GNAT superfamily N-acetyltransferase
MPALVIRPATEADRAALNEQAQGLNVFEEPFSHDRRLDLAGGVESVDTLLNRVVETGGSLLVAELDGAVVGHMALWFDRMPPFVREELRDYAYLGDLFVREAHRSQGIGRALIAEAERLARARGVKRILLGVLPGNPAEAVYRKLGYRTYALELAKDL